MFDVLLSHSLEQFGKEYSKNKTMNNDKEFVWTDELVKEFLSEIFEKDKSKLTVFQDAANYFKQSKQPKKEKLFTTEDGRIAYEQDTWQVFKVDEKYQILQFAACDANPLGNFQCKYFSSKEAAETYIKKHKPKYSEEEMYKCFESAIQLVAKNVNTFEQMAASFNAIIKSSQEKETK